MGKDLGVTFFQELNTLFALVLYLNAGLVLVNCFSTSAFKEIRLFRGKLNEK